MKRIVFISHSSADKTIAEQVCRFLESHGLPCWVAPRDVTPGKNYGAAIVEAIDECSVFLLILSSESNKSGQVVREVERAASSNSTIIPFRVEDVHPSRDLEFYVSSTHWLDATTKPLDQHLRELLKAVNNWQQSKKEAAIRTPPASVPPPPPPTPLPAAPGRKSPSSAGLLGGVLAALVLCAVLAFWLLRGGKTSPPASAAQPASTVAAIPVHTETAPPPPPPVATLPPSTPNEPVASPPPQVPMTPPLHRRPGELLNTPAPAETAAPPSLNPTRLRPGQTLASPATPPAAVASLMVDVTASSEMHIRGEERKPAFAFDGNASTAWAPMGDGVGQSISVRFKSPVTLTSVSILAAAGNEAQFRVRNRVHTLRLTLSDDTNQLLTFQDEPKMQHFELAHPRTVNWARFEILTVFPGNKMMHTPIFEIAFNRAPE